MFNWFRKSKTEVIEMQFTPVLYSEDEYIAIFVLGKRVMERAHEISIIFNHGTSSIWFERTNLAIELMEIGRGYR